MTKLDRCWALAQELCVSLNTICVLEFYSLVLDDGKRCRLRDGMSYEDALKQMRIIATLRDENHSVGMRPIGYPVTRVSTFGVVG